MAGNSPTLKTTTYQPGARSPNLSTETRPMPWQKPTADAEAEFWKLFEKFQEQGLISKETQVIKQDEPMPEGVQPKEAEECAVGDEEEKGEVHRTPYQEYRRAERAHNKLIGKWQKHTEHLHRMQGQVEEAEMQLAKLKEKLESYHEVADKYVDKIKVSKVELERATKDHHDEMEKQQTVPVKNKVKKSESEKANQGDLKTMQRELETAFER